MKIRSLYIGVSISVVLILTALVPFSIGFTKQTALADCAPSTSAPASTFPVQPGISLRATSNPSVISSGEHIAVTVVLTGASDAYTASSRLGFRLLLTDSLSYTPPAPVTVFISPFQVPVISNGTGTAIISLVMPQLPAGSYQIMPVTERMLSENDSTSTTFPSKLVIQSTVDSPLWIETSSPVITDAQHVSFSTVNMGKGDVVVPATFSYYEGGSALDALKQGTFQAQLTVKSGLNTVTITLPDQIKSLYNPLVRAEVTFANYIQGFSFNPTGAEGSLPTLSGLNLTVSGNRFVPTITSDVCASGIDADAYSGVTLQLTMYTSTGVAKNISISSFTLDQPAVEVVLHKILFHKADHVEARLYKNSHLIDVMNTPVL